MHPITKVNYLTLYKEIIEGQGARATIFLSNDPQIMTRFAPDGVLVADVHNREATRKKLSKVYSNIITLQELCREGESWSEWGLLGSNMSAHDKLKLAPRESSLFVREQRWKASGEGLSMSWRTSTGQLADHVWDD